ncbi:unnamed protein product [Prunus armeniaca]
MDEDMEVPYPDHRRPLYLEGQINDVGPIRSLTKFYVVDVDVAYHALLSRPWLNKHKLVVSTYHQYMNGRIGLRPLRIPGNQAPFNKNEAHYSEAEFYTECIGAGRNPSKDFGTYLPSWTEIRDLSNEELITIMDRERKRHSKVNNHAYDQPQCSKVTLLDGRTVYCL